MQVFQEQMETTLVYASVCTSTFRVVQGKLYGMRPRRNGTIWSMIKFGTVLGGPRQGLLWEAGWVPKMLQEFLVGGA